MLATLMIVFALNGTAQITRLTAASLEECMQDARVATITLMNIGATDVYTDCSNR